MGTIKTLTTMLMTSSSLAIATSALDTFRRDMHSVRAAEEAKDAYLEYVIKYCIQRVDIFLRSV